MRYRENWPTSDFLPDPLAFYVDSDGPFVPSTNRLPDDVCLYCGNEGIVRDARGNCPGCGAPLRRASP